MRNTFAITTFIIMLLVGSLSTQAQNSTIRGDVNLDGEVNISDVTSLIDYLLRGTWGDEPVSPPIEDDHEWVDLGLPSGTLWATCNVGANAPEQYGDYFAWGETTPKENYDWSTYKWCDGRDSTMTKYCTNSSYGYNGFTDNKTELDPEDDAAYVNWGPNWRMPTAEQRQELAKQCTWTWTTRNGVYGRKVTGPNGKSIFLPACGYRSCESLENTGENGHGGFWSCTLNSDSSNCAYILNFTKLDVFWTNESLRFPGRTVRAVRVP